jgi:Ser/Thr protein kinase RdoA (MazF antagonist)
MYRGDVARLEIADARDLADCLFKPPELDEALRSDVMRAAGRLLASTRRAGLIHPDLNLRNILVRLGEAAPVAFIIDLEKCRLVDGVSRHRSARMIARLERSARRFEAQTSQPISASEWETFRLGYAEGEHGKG